MTCYRDRTYCTAACATTECSYMLTDEVRAAAARWWGSEDAPIARGDFSKGCPVFQPVGARMAETFEPLEAYKAGDEVMVDISSPTGEPEWVRARVAGLYRRTGRAPALVARRRNNVKIQTYHPEKVKRV